MASHRQPYDEVLCDDLGSCRNDTYINAVDHTALLEAEARQTRDSGYQKSLRQLCRALCNVEFRPQRKASDKFRSFAWCLAAATGASS
jgi:hypothetical protein